MGNKLIREMRSPRPQRKRVLAETPTPAYIGTDARLVDLWYEWGDALKKLVAASEKVLKSARSVSPDSLVEDADVDDALDALDEIAKQIARAPAASIDGISVKLEWLSWSRARQGAGEIAAIVMSSVVKDLERHYFCRHQSSLPQPISREERRILRERLQKSVEAMVSEGAERTLPT